jgi:hypothetical protein
MKNRILEELLAAGWGNPTSDPSDTKDLEGIARQSLERSGAIIKQFVTSHPSLCLGTAVVFGITLGWWIKRK